MCGFHQTCCAWQDHGGSTGNDFPPEEEESCPGHFINWILLATEVDGLGYCSKIIDAQLLKQMIVRLLPRIMLTRSIGWRLGLQAATGILFTTFILGAIIFLKHAQEHTGPSLVAIEINFQEHFIGRPPSTIRRYDHTF